jgi:hypothetical protein
MLLLQLWIGGSALMGVLWALAGWWLGERPDSPDWTRSTALAGEAEAQHEAA